MINNLEAYKVFYYVAKCGSVTKAAGELSISQPAVSQAVKQVGISRSTYYKYKDYILEPIDIGSGRKAVLSMMLTHEQGVLSALLSKISSAGGSVLTITQSLPIHGKASVTLSLDISAMPGSMAGLIESLGSTPGAEQVRLLAVE